MLPIRATAAHIAPQIIRVLAAPGLFQLFLPLTPAMISITEEITKKAVPIHIDSIDLSITASTSSERFLNPELD